MLTLPVFAGIILSFNTFLLTYLIHHVIPWGCGQNMKDSRYNTSLLVIILILITLAITGAVICSHQPDIRPAAVTISPIRLVFVGDVMLSRQVGEIIEHESPRFPFDRVKSTLMAGDITMGNLESPLSALNTTACEKKYCFRASPDAADGLVYAGFDIMTVANNHALDYGPEVMNDTLNYLSAAGVLYTGAHLHREDSIQSPVIINKQGTDIAYLGFNDIGNSTTTNGYPRPWVASENAVKLAVEQARNEADIVVVVFHFGNEYSFSHSKRQEHLAHAAADAGADIIVGHHPHVIQEVEVYNRSIIAYSLGNFVFDQSGRAGVKEGNIFTVEVDPATKKIRGYSLDTVTINSKFQPRVSTTADFVQTITPTS